MPEETTITQQQDSNDGHDMNKGTNTNAQGYEPKGVLIYRIAEKKQTPKEGHTRK